MAGDWIKFEVSTPEKQEVLAITVAMGWDDPDLTVGKLLRVWRWFDQHTVDGNGHGVSAALLDRIAGVTGFASAMEKVGWLSVTKDGIELSNFGRHNGETAKSRALTAKRVAKHKANAEANATGNDKGNAANVTGELPREEKRREEEKDTSGKPARAEAKAILDYLNAKAGSEYRAVESNLRLIDARLKSGVTVEQCKAIVDAKVAEWTGTKQAMYLRPETLFGATKFEQYLGQLQSATMSQPAETTVTADGATFIPGYGKCY